MINAIYGKKIGMTQIFGEDDRVVPVTVIQAEPNKVCQVKTKDTDGYEAVQMGFGAIKEKKVNKPMKGHFEKQGAAPYATCARCAWRMPASTRWATSRRSPPFAETKKVDVTGTSKGKGLRRRHEALTASAAARAATARTSIALPARWASAPRRPACSRAQAPGPHGLRHRDGEEPRGRARRRDQNLIS